MSITDIVVLLLSFFLFLRGWEKGLLHSLVGPIALISASVMGYMLYLNGQLIQGLVIGLLGPLILSIFLSAIVRHYIKATNPEGEPIALSRIFGGLISIIWSGSIILFVIIALSLIPQGIPGLQSMHADIHKSKTFLAIKPVLAKIPMINTLVASDNARPGTSTGPGQIDLSDPQKIQQIQQSSEYQEIISDPRIQDIINDPSLTAAAQSGNIGQMISNPKLMELTKDPALLKKFMRMYQLMQGK